MPQAPEWEWEGKARAYKGPLGFPVAPNLGFLILQTPFFYFTGISTPGPGPSPSTMDKKKGRMMNKNTDVNIWGRGHT